MYRTSGVLRRCGRPLMALVALVLLVAPVSHAQVPLSDVTTTTDLAVDALKKPGPKPGPIKVSEPDPNVLLLLGLGGLGLVGYAVHRRRRAA
jgi:hypothetical protein